MSRFRSGWSGPNEGLTPAEVEAVLKPIIDGYAPRIIEIGRRLGQLNLQMTGQVGGVELPKVASTPQ